MIEKPLIRCDWVGSDSLEQQYHDHEWGRIQKDGYKLFEKICLEGQQAGLSWITILKKREEYRRCFYYFDPHKIITITSIDPLLQNPGLIRHPAKLNAIIKNAQAYVHMEKNGEDFSRFIWSFVDHKSIINHYSSLTEIPTQTDISHTMSRALKKRGFVFVGPVTCYAFMQSMGLVNDHINNCFCRSL